VIFNRHVITGKKGRTICYKIAGFRYDKQDECIKWDDFRFYTPEGDQVDSDGFEYFDVPADEILIQRDPDLDKELLVIITRHRGVDAVEVLAGAEMDPLIIGLDGDIVANCFIPASTTQELVLDYKEIPNG